MYLINKVHATELSKNCKQSIDIHIPEYRIQEIESTLNKIRNKTINTKICNTFWK